MNKQLIQSILVSYVVGAPVGLFVVFATILLPGMITGEWLLAMLFTGIYEFSTVGLVVAFLLALWVGGKVAYKNSKEGNSLLKTSFKYSTVVNAIIWSVFCLIVLITVSQERFLMLIPPFIAFVLCTVLTTFSIGLLVAYMVRRIQLKKDQ